MPVEASFRVGLDYWHMDAPAANAGVKDLLFMADSTPQWSYKNPAPWMTFEGRARVRYDTALNLKYRGNQSSGGRLDEASVDWALSPSLGFRAGVVDYKTSWCRIYEIDSPWVRENDPFCTVRTTDEATSAAPGAQIYLKTYLGPYDLQAIAGVYRPKLWGYRPKEFSATRMSYDSRVDYNKKLGLSVEMLNAETATSFRFSWLGLDQEAHLQYSPGGDFYRVQGVGNIYYLATSFALTSKVKLRLTHLRSDVIKSTFVPLIPVRQAASDSRRRSSTVELSYQVSSKDILVAGYSAYPYVQDSFDTDADGALIQPRYAYYVFQSKSLSLAWRRDHGHGVFTALQWTRATMTRDNDGMADGAAGQAIGLRLGYEY